MQAAALTLGKQVHNSSSDLRTIVPFPLCHRVRAQGSADCKRNLQATMPAVVSLRHVVGTCVQARMIWLSSKLAFRTSM